MSNFEIKGAKALPSDARAGQHDVDAVVRRYRKLFSLCNRFYSAV